MTIDINKEIAVRARFYRKKYGFSQENIADMLGVTRASYVNMEGGRQGWSPLYLYTLCRIFKCKPNNLFPKIKPVRIKSRVAKRIVRVVKNKRVFSKI